MSHKTAFLGKDPVFPLLLKMGVPMAVGMLINALYNIVDTIFVGHGVGPLAIAALTIIFPIQMLVSSFAQAMGFGAASIISRRLGEKRYDDASYAVGTAYLSVSICTITIVVLVFIFMKPVLTLFGATERIMPYAVDYLQVISIGFFFFALSMTANGLTRAEGNAKASMNGMIIGAVLNCVLNPIFIFAFHWGVRGSAFATVISQMVSCGYFLSIYVLKKSHIEISLKHMVIRKDLLLESSLLGIPAFVQEAGMSVLSLVINNSIKFYGGDTAIIGYGMVMRFGTLIILPVIGIIQGFQPIAGYNYGARNFTRVRRSLQVTMLTAVAISLFGYALMMFFPRICMGIFTTDRESVNAGVQILHIMMILIPLAAVQITGSVYFQAIGKPLPSLILGLSRQMIVLIPLIVILPLLAGLNGIWLSFPLSDFISTAITAVFLFFSLKRMEIMEIMERTRTKPIESAESSN
jgi:putative MATE family efflux protein